VTGGLRRWGANCQDGSTVRLEVSISRCTEHGLARYTFRLTGAAYLKLACASSRGQFHYFVRRWGYRSRFSYIASRRLRCSLSKLFVCDQTGSALALHTCVITERCSNMLDSILAQVHPCATRAEVTSFWLSRISETGRFDRKERQAEGAASTRRLTMPLALSSDSDILAQTRSLKKTIYPLWSAARNKFNPKTVQTLSYSALVTK
jgi:hypothetical protein